MGESSNFYEFQRNSVYVWIRFKFFFIINYNFYVENQNNK